MNGRSGFAVTKATGLGFTNSFPRYCNVVPNNVCARDFATHYYCRCRRCTDADKRIYDEVARFCEGSNQSCDEFDRKLTRM